MLITHVKTYLTMVNFFLTNVIKRKRVLVGAAGIIFRTVDPSAELFGMIDSFGHRPLFYISVVVGDRLATELTHS